MTITKWTGVALIAVLVAGCGTLPLPSKNYVAGETIPPGHGLLATHLHSNWKPKDPKKFNTMLVYWVRPAEHPNTGFFSLRVDDISKQQLIPIPAGRYYFASLKLGSDYLALNKKSTFEIKEGQITYVGDIFTRIQFFPERARIWVLSYPEREKQYLRTSYPGLLETMEFKTELLQLSPGKKAPGI